MHMIVKRRAVWLKGNSCLRLWSYDNKHASDRRANVTVTQQLDEYQRPPFIKYTDSEFTIRRQI